MFRKIIHWLALILLWAVVLFLCFTAIAAASSADDWARLCEILKNHRFDVIISSLALAGLVLLSIITAHKRKKERFFTNATATGTVQISEHALTDYIERLMAEFPDIKKLTPEIFFHESWIDIGVRINILDGSRVNEVCSALQKRIRDGIVSGFGLTQVGRVEIIIDKLIRK